MLLTAGGTFPPQSWSRFGFGCEASWLASSIRSLRVMLDGWRDPDPPLQWWSLSLRPERPLPDTKLQTPVLFSLDPGMRSVPLERPPRKRVGSARILPQARSERKRDRRCEWKQRNLLRRFPLTLAPGRVEQTCCSKWKQKWSVELRKKEEKNSSRKGEIAQRARSYVWPWTRPASSRFFVSFWHNGYPERIGVELKKKEMACSVISKGSTNHPLHTLSLSRVRSSPPGLELGYGRTTCEAAYGWWMQLGLINHVSGNARCKAAPAPLWSSAGQRLSDQRWKQQSPANKHLQRVGPLGSGGFALISYGYNRDRTVTERCYKHRVMSCLLRILQFLTIRQ